MANLVRTDKDWVVDPDEPQHTCWDTPEWSGVMQDGCKGCDYAAENLCDYCGYGHMFTTHNPELHEEV